MGLFRDLFGSRFSSGFLFGRSNRRVTKRRAPNSTFPLSDSVELQRDDDEDDVKTDAEGSFYSLTTEILPPFGAHSNRRVRLRRFCFSPYDRRYRFLPFQNRIFLLLLEQELGAASHF